jgi:hypothetical protein
MKDGPLPRPGSEERPRGGRPARGVGSHVRASHRSRRNLSPFLSSPSPTLPGPAHLAPVTIGRVRDNFHTSNRLQPTKEKIPNEANPIFGQCASTAWITSGGRPRRRSCRHAYALAKSNQGSPGGLRFSGIRLWHGSFSQACFACAGFTWGLIRLSYGEASRTGRPLSGQHPARPRFDVPPSLLMTRMPGCAPARRATPICCMLAFNAPNGRGAYEPREQFGSEPLRRVL